MHDGHMTKYLSLQVIFKCDLDQFNCIDYCIRIWNDAFNYKSHAGRIQTEFNFVFGVIICLTHQNKSC